MDIEAVFRAALEHYQADNIEKAESFLARLPKKLQTQPKIAHLSALIALRIEKPERAVKILRKAVLVSAPRAELFGLLGSALHQMSKVGEAIKVFQKALEIDPDHVDTHYSLGNALKDSGSFNDAIRSYRRVLELDPTDDDSHYNLGLCLLKTSAFAEAAEVFRHLVNKDPADVEAGLSLALAFQKQGDFDVAASSLATLSLSAPSDIKVLTRLGELQCLAGLFPEAVSSLESALKLAPSSPNVMNGLGKVYLEQDEEDRAMKYFQHAYDAAPQSAPIIVNLIGLMEKKSMLTEARTLLNTALVSTSDDPNLNFLMARLDRRDGDFDAAAKRLEKLSVDYCDGSIQGSEAYLDLGRLNDRQGETDQDFKKFESEICFELGRLYDRQGKTDQAFEKLERGNRIASQSWVSKRTDKHAIFSYISRLEKCFNVEWFHSWTSAPTDKSRPSPVFLIGFPRSGTTLLDQIIDGHSKIQVIEEKPTIDRVRGRIAEHEDDFPAVLAKLGKDEIYQLRDFYFNCVSEITDLEPGAILVDKMPLYAIDAGLIHRLFPDARFIFALRHPCDVTLSCFMQAFETNEAMVNFFTLKDTVSLYAEVMNLWAIYEEILPIQVHYVRYEDLVEDLEPTVRKLFDFLQLDWQEQVLNFTVHAKRRTINTPSYSQVTEKLYTHAKFRWHSYRHQFSKVLPILQPFIERFGYDSEC